MRDGIVRIGGASGAWGDSPDAIRQLLTTDVDFLIMDYLAEVTMSLLARARLRDPAAGYPPDFVAYLRDHLPEIARRGIKVVSNAGGVNPQGCRQAIQAACAELGLDLTVAVVEGDDVLPHLAGLALDEAPPAKLLTANAYLGALPIAAALAAGADIVVTGRCADSALALGILMNTFGWAADEYDHLAAGSSVGHILECGPQATGGTFTDWESVPNWELIGYPIAACHADGSFEVSKPPGTGGLIVPGVIAEQTLYEVGDPAAYILPDVVADFSQVAIEQAGPDRVRVSGARGRPPTRQYKVSATYQDGYRAVATVSIVGPDAARKAERTADALVTRARARFAARGWPDFSGVHVEALGAESAYGPDARTRATREVLLRLVVDHPRRDALDAFARELGSVGLGFAPGTTGIFGGRPKPIPVIRLFTCFVDKAALPPPRVQVGDAEPFEVAIPGGVELQAQVRDRPEPDHAASAGETIEVPLLTLAFARSGDKGDSSNIAIIAREPAYVPLLRRELTAERVAEHFRHVATGPVHRFEAPGLHAFNFVVENALGGGGMASRRIDPQGKAYGQRALEMMVRVPRSLIASRQ